jgi:NADH-quinone oxidoreductase subunit I
VLGHEHRLSFTDRRDAIFTKDMLIDPPPEGMSDTPQTVEPGVYTRSIPDMPNPL